MGHLTGMVTGLRAEARLLRGRPLVACAGAEPEAAARVLIAAGASGLMSIGLAGGLAPTLKPGSVVLATEVICGDRRYPTDSVWHRLALRPGMVAAPLLTPAAPLLTCADKAAAHAASGAAAVDMESGAVARVAAAAGLPFLALRAIADPAGRAVPAAAMRVVDGQGGLRAGAALRALLRHPLAMLMLACETRRAMAALRMVITADPMLFPRSG